MYNYQNTRVETKRGQFYPSSNRMVQVLRNKQSFLSQNKENNAQDVITIHRSLQRVIVKELNKQVLFEKTKFLPNSCEDQYFTAIDPIEMEDYTKIYENVAELIDMDPIQIKKAREIAEQKRQEKEREKALFEQKNIVKQRMQSILDKHNKNQNNNNNNTNVPKEEVHLKPHDQKVLGQLNEMYTVQPTSVKNATTVQKVVSNLSQFEKTKNTLISQAKVPYQQIIKASNNSVLMTRCRKRSNTTISETTSGIQKQLSSPRRVEQNIIEQNQQNNTLFLQQYDNINNISKQNSMNRSSSNKFQLEQRRQTEGTVFIPQNKIERKINGKDLQIQDSENHTYYNPAQTTFSSTLNYNRVKQFNSTLSPYNSSFTQRQALNHSSHDKLRLRNSNSLMNNKLNLNSSKSLSMARGNSQQSAINQFEELYLTQCAQQSEIIETDSNSIKKNIKKQISSISIDPFGPSLRQHSKESSSNTKNTQSSVEKGIDQNKKNKVKFINPMKQYYDIDADNEKREMEYKSLDISFDQFQRKYHISLNGGKPSSILIQLPSLEKELKIKGLKKQQEEEQQKRYKMNLNLNQLQEFKGFKFPLNDSTVLPIKTNHTTRINYGNNSTVNVNGNNSMVGQNSGSSQNNRKSTFNIFYKGSNSIILQPKERQRSLSSFQNLARSDSLQQHQDQKNLQRQTSITIQNSNSNQNILNMKPPVLSSSPFKNKQQIQNLCLSLTNSQELHKSEVMTNSIQQKNIQNQQQLNSSLSSPLRIRLVESPLISGRSKSKDNTQKAPKHNIQLKRQQSGKYNSQQNQVSFNPSIASNIQISPSSSQSQLMDRISPQKTAILQDSRKFEFSLNRIEIQQNTQQQLNTKNISNNSNIIYEASEIKTPIQRNSKFQFFEKHNKQRNENEKSAEMKINENKKKQEQIKSKKFKKLVNRTHKCEDKAIDGCRSFYVKKKEKNQELYQLFLTHYRDRPKTSEIRSRYYSCVPSETEKFSLKVAREKSENERIQLSKVNEPQQEYYRNLVNKLIMKSNSGDNMNICVYVMNAFKTVLEDLDSFESHHFFQLLEKIEERDSYIYNPTTYFMISSILDHLSLSFYQVTDFKKLNQFVSYFQNLETNEQLKTQSTLNQEKQKLSSEMLLITIQNQDTIEDFKD